MTVVLSGVGADTTNVSPVPSLHEDRGFSYLPIPERGRDATTETERYGSWRMRDGSHAVRYVEELRPRGDDSLVVSGDEVGSWPLHHDPNFEAATYGERRPAYTHKLLELGDGDLVAFYTGLRSDDTLHRYLIGYVEVAEVYDVDGMEQENAVEVLRDNPENAHSKRWQATGEVDDGLVVVDGRDAELYDHAFPISVQQPNGHYYLKPELEDRWSPRSSGEGTAYLGGVKQAHLLDVTAGDFVADIRHLS